MQEGRPPESDEDLHRFLEDAPLGLRWVDSEGRILWANRAELALVGCAEHPQEYIGHHVAEFLVSPQAAMDLLSRLARQETVVSFEARIRCRDGSVRNVLMDGNALFRDGRLVHSRCFTRDITGLLEKEEAARHRAEETSHLQDDFLALLSHELRAPLGTVLLWLGLLQQGDIEPEEATRAIEIMGRSARTLEHIVEDLLHASRIAAGGLTLDPARIDLRDVVQQAVDASWGDAAVKGLRFAWSAPPEPVLILGDAGRLQQAVSNLLSNAIKFTHAGGEIDVRLDTGDRQARLCVRDTGEGMSPGFLPFAFGRFRQQDSTSSRAHHGLGLGLYVVRHVIEHHGGRVLAESPGVERGSTFTVLLPMAAHQEMHAVPRVAALTGGTVIPLPTGLKVLVVDDEDDVRDALTLLLEQSGVTVTGASSAREALAAVEAQPPDVILSDIAMPEKDGLAFIREVRALPAARGGTIPAIALSAYASSEHRSQALLAGFQEHLRKPIETALLLAAIGRLAGAGLVGVGRVDRLGPA